MWAIERVLAPRHAVYHVFIPSLKIFVCQKLTLFFPRSCHLAYELCLDTAVKLLVKKTSILLIHGEKKYIFAPVLSQTVSWLFSVCKRLLSILSANKCINCIVLRDLRRFNVKLCVVLRGPKAVGPLQFRDENTWEPWGMGFSRTAQFTKLKQQLKSQNAKVWESEYRNSLNEQKTVILHSQHTHIVQLLQELWMMKVYMGSESNWVNSCEG